VDLAIQVPVALATLDPAVEHTLDRAAVGDVQVCVAKSRLPNPRVNADLRQRASPVATAGYAQR